MGLHKKLKGIIPIILLSGWSVPTNAQDNAASKRSQITFIYPLGTNGVNSVDYTNSVSFNVLMGLNGGVNGFEFAGLANVNTGSTQGIQISGIANVADQNSKGFQMGLTNIVKGGTKDYSWDFSTIPKDSMAQQLYIMLW